MAKRRDPHILPSEPEAGWDGHLRVLGWQLRLWTLLTPTQYIYALHQGFLQPEGRWVRRMHVFGYREVVTAALAALLLRMGRPKLAWRLARIGAETPEVEEAVRGWLVRRLRDPSVGLDHLVDAVPVRRWVDHSIQQIVQSV
jgi:hypothetical protein